MYAMYPTPCGDSPTPTTHRRSLLSIVAAFALVFYSPDLAGFHDLYISSDEKLFNKILTCPNGHSCHHLLHRITVLEIDLTTDSYLTAFLE